MTAFALRAIGLATVLYFVFVFPMGKQTFAQAVAEVWDQTHLRHAIEVKTAEMRREMTAKMHRWQKTQAMHGDLDSEGRLAADADADAAQVDASQPADFDAPPVPRPQQRATKPHPKHSRGRPGARQTPAQGDDPL